MLTLSKFVGAFTQGLTLGRTMSDGTSVKVAQQYLNHDYLRGFPIPRMTLKHVDLDVNFTVGSFMGLDTLLGEPEVRKNIVNRFREMLAQLPSSDTFKSQFGSNKVPDEWDEQVETLLATIERVLGSKLGDRSGLTYVLGLAIENFFYELHRAKPNEGLLAGLRALFSGSDDTPHPAPSADAIRTWASQQVTSLLDAALPPDTSDLPDLNILVGGADLEAIGPGNLHTAKLSFAADDRKWVASERNGEKNFTLDR